MKLASPKRVLAARRASGITVLAILLLVCAGSAAAQSAPPQSQSTPESPRTPDYSHEPYVIEQYFTRVRFENNGTGERELTVRIRVQSEAGVQQLGELMFEYNSANERMDVNYVRVHKSDGSVVAASAGAVKDLTAPIARDAPVYADTHEKRITVPALRPGETLEYNIVTHQVTPLAPGQFWLEHNFLEGAIVLDERFEVNVPRSRAVKIKTQPGFDPAISNEGDRCVYRWTHAIRERPPEEDAAKKETKKEAKIPAVQLTTFSSWEDVGRWYAQLERDRITPSPEIRAKALELVEGRTSDLEKIAALYDYVAKNVRYVSLSFGTGRYQPHAAAEVFSNQYGDCKDKHTLLAALLASAGLHADAVLIPILRKIDPDLPSPAQFDHVITAVPVGDDLIWMDTTTEVAPFRLLIPNLRKKQALLVTPEGSARLMETPADPPFPGTQTVEIDGQVSELGKLTALVRYEMRGDNELALRLAFRRTPQAKWKELGQTIALLDGLKGDVSEVTPGDPAATQRPFELTLTLSSPNFLDWTGKKSQLSLPLPNVGLPATTEETTEDIELGSPLDVTERLKLALPGNFVARPPVAMAVARDYAEYRSLYKMENHVFTAERILRFRRRVVPASRAGDYLAFTRAVQSDEAQELSLESTAPGPAIPANAKAEDLNEAGAAALDRGNYAAAAELFRRLTELEPKHKSAWNNLGRAYLGLGNSSKAVAAFRKQVEVNPFDQYAYNNLGLAYLLQENYDEAAGAFRKQIENNPLDKFAHASLGSIYLQQRRYAEAVAELEKATVLNPDNAALQVALGRAYLNLNQNDKALATFDRAVEMAPSPQVWNDVAYELALHNLQLDRAEQYAESAVAATAAALRNVELDRLTLQDLSLVGGLGSYWDTLGWVRFQKGDLDAAEKYVLAAWQLDQVGEVGDHLAQIYEKRGRKPEAIETYALALVAKRPAPETRGRLVALLGDDSKVSALQNNARNDLSASRTLSLGKLGLSDAQAEFYILLAPGQKVEAVKFIKGSDTLRPLADRLRTFKYPQLFPDATPAKLVRRGILSCSSASGECAFVLVLPEDVHSVD